MEFLKNSTSEQSLFSSNKPQLRPYQQQVIKDIYTLIRNGIKRNLIFAPTAAGKTIIGAQIIAHAVSRNRKVLFVVHRDILISQTQEKLRLYGINTGFIKAGLSENRDALVQIASVQTLQSRRWWRETQDSLYFYLIIFDECHIVAFSSIAQQMMTEIFPSSLYLGLTATPWRLSKKESLGDIFKGIACAPMPHELIEQGYIVKPSYYGIEQPDLKKVKTTNGEFNNAQLAIACDQPELIEQVVQEWFRLAYGRRTIAFTVTIEHSRHICEAFQKRGIRAAHVDASTPTQVANQIYQQLATGEIWLVSSCMKLTEGFDVPSVSCILLCRPTKSKALFFQMVGRGLRLSPETNKRDCLIIDQAGNVIRHSYIEDLKTINLHLSEQTEAGDAPKKLCPSADGGCGHYIYAGIMRCPHCSYKFILTEKMPYLQAIKQLLSKADKEKLDFYRERLQEGYKKLYSPGWAAIVFQEKYGHWPPDDWAKNAIFGYRFTSKDRETYQKYLIQIQEKNQKSDDWIKRYMSMEFGLTEGIVKQAQCL